MLGTLRIKAIIAIALLSILLSSLLFYIYSDWPNSAAHRPKMDTHAWAVDVTEDDLTSYLLPDTSSDGAPPAVQSEDVSSSLLQNDLTFADPSFAEAHNQKQDELSSVRDHTLAAAQDSELRDELFELHVEICMEEYGFKYYPVTAESNGEEHSEAYLDQNDQYVNDLSEQRRDEYLEKLYGLEGPNYLGGSANTSTGRVDGCISKSKMIVSPIDYVLDDLHYFATFGDGEAFNVDPRVSSVLDQWAQCMSHQGLLFGNPTELYLHVLEELERSPDRSPSTEVMTAVLAHKSCDQSVGLNYQKRSITTELP